MKTETKCLHAGYEPKNGEPREVPIYQSTTFKYDSSLQMGRLFDLEDSGYFYSRLQNPTNDIVASKIADNVGITRSVIVNALRKFESAGVIDCKSSGMKETYIKVVNEYVFEELSKLDD